MMEPFTSGTSVLDALIRKLSTIALLSAEEKSAVRDLPVIVNRIGAQDTIAREGDRPVHCVLVGSGWLCRHKMTPGGKRQIVSLHLPGDMPDLQSLLLKEMDHSLSAITPATLGLIRHDHINDLHLRYPNLAKAMWRDTLVDAATYRDWLLGVGRRTAEERMAHLFCEMYVRSRAVGLVADEATCDWPLSQAEMADALGLSLVHVNRTLQTLRSQSLVTLSKGRLEIKDWDGLCELSGFDPSYLHLIKPPA